MSFWEVITQTWANLRANKLRSLLTMFGITWGIASVVLLGAIGEGFQMQNTKLFKSIGKDVIIFWPGRPKVQAGSQRRGRRIRFTERDVEVLKARAQRFRFSPEITSYNEEMRVGPRVMTTQLHGVGPEFADIRSVVPDNGRFISERDIQEQRRVCVLGDEVRKKLFGPSDPLHRSISIGGREFLIIGWLSDKEQRAYYSGPDNENVYCPWTVAYNMYEHAWFNNIVLQPNSLDEHDAALYEFRYIMGRLHHFDPMDEDAFHMWDTSKSAERSRLMMLAVEILLLTVGAITLAIGGAGVMNIMFVNVVERTREIGIRRAIGARRWTIVRQFLAESMAISLIAGIVGIGLGYGLVKILNTDKIVTLPEGFAPPIVSSTSMVISAALLIIVAILAGTFPAIRAARVDPIEALHRE